MRYYCTNLGIYRFETFPRRAAMNSIKMLRGDLPSSGDQPSSKLATYFKVGLLKTQSIAFFSNCRFLFVLFFLPPSLELHCGPNPGYSEAFGDAWTGVQSDVW